MCSKYDDVVVVGILYVDLCAAVLWNLHALKGSSKSSGFELACASVRHWTVVWVVLIKGVLIGSIFDAPGRQDWC